MTTGSSPHPYEAALAAKPLHDVRQQILLLYLGGSDLGAQVIGWTLYDGTGRYNYDSNESDEPIYKTGLEALRLQSGNHVHLALEYLAREAKQSNGQTPLHV